MAVLVHLPHFITLIAFLVRGILTVRLLLVVAQTMVAVQMFSHGTPDVLPIAMWNTLFATINIVWISLILHERRRVALPADLQPIYDRRFVAMSQREFLRWWATGHRERVRDRRLAAQGEHPDFLYFLLSGQARVSRAGAMITELPAGFFVAEMSLITGQPANADVDAIGEVDVIRWPAREITALRERSPGLWTKIQSALGSDLVEKIRRGDERLAAH
jgi:hypothetical protein